MTRSESQSVKTACWSCGSTLENGALFCIACGKIQPSVAATSYFAVFSLPEKLSIDTSALEKAFYRLSRKLHPDLYARATAQEQQWSLEQASLLNDAYRTLKNPMARTEYLLKLEGMEVEERPAEGMKKESRAPADLLEEVFELNMQLEEMRMTRQMGDEDPQLRADLEKAKAQFESQLAESDASLEAEWSKWDAALDTGDEAVKEKAKTQMAALLDRRRYVKNLVRDVNDALES